MMGVCGWRCHSASRSASGGAAVVLSSVLQRQLFATDRCSSGFPEYTVVASLVGFALRLVFGRPDRRVVSAFRRWRSQRQRQSQRQLPRSAGARRTVFGFFARPFLQPRISKLGKPSGTSVASRPWGCVCQFHWLRRNPSERSHARRAARCHGPWRIFPVPRHQPCSRREQRCTPLVPFRCLHRPDQEPGRQHQRCSR